MCTEAKQETLSQAFVLLSDGRERFTPRVVGILKSRVYIVESQGQRSPKAPDREGTGECMAGRYESGLAGYRDGNSCL